MKNPKNSILLISNLHLFNLVYNSQFSNYFNILLIYILYLKINKNIIEINNNKNINKFF